MPTTRYATMLLTLMCAIGLVAGQCAAAPAPKGAKIILLHHSTGECVWNGGVRQWFAGYNKAHGTQYEIAEQAFPKSEPYGWNNYPYDYWNIWVRHAGDKAYQTEPTLEMLTKTYDVIVFKHCFPVSQIEADTGAADVTSQDKRVENYRLQYAALKKKMLAFPKTEFVVWTGAALTRGETTPAAAKRAKGFFNWVRGTWDQRGDNIFLWDFQSLETQGGLYMKDEHAQAKSDSHPNEAFSKKVAPLLCQRVVDVIQGRGDTGKRGQSLPARKPGPMPGPAPKGGAKPTEKQPKRVPVQEDVPGPGTWSFDNAEAIRRLRSVWGKGATYVKDGEGHVIKLTFAQGAEEDWGEYGPHRVVTTVAAKRNDNIGAFRYLALRIRADREMQITLALVTVPEGDETGDSYFGFTGYLRPTKNEWTQVVLDLTTLELSAEGDRAYAAAGKPTRPKALTYLKFAAHKKHEKANVAVDDITFHKTLPDSLKDAVQKP